MNFIILILILTVFYIPVPTSFSDFRKVGQEQGFFTVELSPTKKLVPHLVFFF